jgi:hypothetical protein
MADGLEDTSSDKSAPTYSLADQVYYSEEQGGNRLDVAESFSSEGRKYKDRLSGGFDIDYKPHVVKGINACEDKFLCIIKWPSLGGTYEDYSKAVDAFSSSENCQLVTIGLRADFDESSSRCCVQEGNVTALLHMIADKYEPFRAAKNIWDKVVQIEKEGRKPGFYALTVHSNWLLVL